MSVKSTTGTLWASLFNGRLICVFVCGCSLFSLLCNVLLCAFTTVYPFQCDGHLGCFRSGLVLIVNIFMVQEVDILRPKLEDLASVAEDCILEHLTVDGGEQAILKSQVGEGRGGRREGGGSVELED